MDGGCVCVGVGMDGVLCCTCTHACTSTYTYMYTHVCPSSSVTAIPQQEMAEAFKQEYFAEASQLTAAVALHDATTSTQPSCSSS